MAGSRADYLPDSRSDRGGDIEQQFIAMELLEGVPLYERIRAVRSVDSNATRQRDLCVELRTPIFPHAALLRADPPF